MATIIPFDVNSITSGNIPAATVSKKKKSPVIAPEPVTTTAVRTDTPFTPVSHYAENITPIGKIQWRKRAHVQGRVTALSTAPRGSAPTLQVEVWDETGGVTLNFLGRREIAGLEVGMEIRAEGMVGEVEGTLVILNPSYELVI